MAIERKVAVIAGASQGIGAALVDAFRNRDYRVVAVARSVKPSSDDDVLAVAGKIAERTAAERAVAEGLARFGRIDTLATTPASSSRSRSPATARRTMRRPSPSISPASATDAARG